MCLSHWSHFTQRPVILLHVVYMTMPCWIWSVITTSSREACHWPSHDPTLASRLDPSFCFSSFCFLCSAHSIKSSVLTTLTTVPLTRLSTLSSMPNPVVRFVLWAYISLVIPSPSLLLASLPLTRISMFECPRPLPWGPEHSLAQMMACILPEAAADGILRPATCQAWYPQLWHLDSDNLGSSI